MATFKRSEELEVWQKARRQCKGLFDSAKSDPFNKDFDLKRQLLRSAGSVMDNIAEGFEREGTREFIQFLSIAKGSNGETRSQLYRAYDFNYLDEEAFSEHLEDNEELSRDLNGFIKYLKGTRVKGKKFDRA